MTYAVMHNTVTFSSNKKNSNVQTPKHQGGFAVYYSIIFFHNKKNAHI